MWLVVANTLSVYSSNRFLLSSLSLKCYLWTLPAFICNHNAASVCYLLKSAYCQLFLLKQEVKCEHDLREQMFKLFTSTMSRLVWAPDLNLLSIVHKIKWNIRWVKSVQRWTAAKEKRTGDVWYLRGRLAYNSISALQRLTREGERTGKERETKTTTMKKTRAKKWTMREQCEER